MSILEFQCKIGFRILRHHGRVTPLRQNTFELTFGTAIEGAMEKRGYKEQFLTIEPQIPDVDIYCLLSLLSQSDIETEGLQNDTHPPEIYCSFYFDMLLCGNFCKRESIYFATSHFYSFLIKFFLKCYYKQTANESGNLYKICVS